MLLKVGYTMDELDELDEIIQDAVSNDEGKLSNTSLLHYLHMRGWTLIHIQGEIEEHNDVVRELEGAMAQHDADQACLLEAAKERERLIAQIAAMAMSKDRGGTC